MEEKHHLDMTSDELEMSQHLKSPRWTVIHLLILGFVVEASIVVWWFWG